MSTRPTQFTDPARSRCHWLRFFAVLGFVLPILAIILYFVYVTNDLALHDADTVITQEGDAVALEPLPFPVGVDPVEKEIAELPQVENYLTEELNITLPNETPEHIGFVKKVISKLALVDWYQGLAAGASRILIIEPGDRKEQVAMNFKKILKWTPEEEHEFLASIVSSDPVFLEGKLFPGTYVVAQGAKPADVVPLIVNRFNEEVLTRYTPDVSKKVSLHDALTIASLLEREAYDFEDMRYISGVIWNRLFVDMNLQIDATLQYAKGTASVKTWWPKPVPDDKYIDSPYNTYQNSGLPPTPIANPSIDAVLAALNPRETTCMYYFHDKKGGFHCTETYEEHVALLKKFYGRGK